MPSYLASSYSEAARCGGKEARSLRFAIGSPASRSDSHSRKELWEPGFWGPPPWRSPKAGMDPEDSSVKTRGNELLIGRLPAARATFQAPQGGTVLSFDDQAM